MEEQKSIADLSMLELKAYAYDQLAQIQQCQNNLKILNDEIARRVSVNHKPSLLTTLPAEAFNEHAVSDKGVD